MNYELLMKRALEISAPYKYLAKPNPMVGALITKEGLILAEGAHEKFGGAHAVLMRLMMKLMIVM